MSLSITILSPMPGAQLSQNFTVSGTYNTNAIMRENPDRNSLFAYANRIDVSLSGPSNVSATLVSVGRTTWTATFSNVPPATGYVVTATLSDGVHPSASNTVETVDVLSAARLAINDPSAPKQSHAAQLLKLEAGAQKLSLDGVYTGNAASVLAVNLKIGRHQEAAGDNRVHFTPGRAVRSATGTVDPKKNTWDVQIEVDPDSYVVVYLLDGNNNVVGQVASQLY